MYHSRPTDLVVRCIAVGLENAFELSQEPLRPIASATQAEIEPHASSGATVLPEVRLVVLTPALSHRTREGQGTRFVCGESMGQPPARFAFAASNDSIDSMATLTIRQLDEKTKTRLRVRAAHHGRSMEEEAREILRSALTAASPAKGNLAEGIRRRFAALGGVELKLPRRGPMRRAAEFGE